MGQEGWEEVGGPVEAGMQEGVMEGRAAVGVVGRVVVVEDEVVVGTGTPSRLSAVFCSRG